MRHEREASTASYSCSYNSDTSETNCLREESFDSVFVLDDSSPSVPSSQENWFVPPTSIPPTISIDTFTRQVNSLAMSTSEPAFICSDVLRKYCDGNISGEAISLLRCGHSLCRKNQDILVKEAIANGLSLSNCKGLDEHMSVAQGIKLTSVDSIRHLKNVEFDDDLDLQESYLGDTRKGVELPAKAYQPYLQDTRK
eukprot:g34113.t1